MVLFVHNHGNCREKISMPDKTRRSVHFDEIELADYDKERGTRMKIDEPDTPFARSPLISDSDDQESKPKDIRPRPRFFPQHESSPASSSHDSDLSPRDEAAHKAFVLKRKAHYNEIKVAKSVNAKKLTEEAYSDSEHEEKRSRNSK